MANRRLNHRLVKIRRSYVVNEAAELLGVHRNTVREWIKKGLPVIDDNRPTLILGSDLREFLEGRRRQRRQPCGPGEIYCVRCRQPRRPALGMVDYVPTTATAGNLRGLCPDCETLIHRATSLAKLDQTTGDLDVSFREAKDNLAGCQRPPVNSDFGRNGGGDEKAQRQERAHQA